MQDIQVVKAKFGERVRDLIEAQGWTFTGFCKTTGISNSLIYKYLNGVTEPGVTNLLRIAETLKVSADCLLGLEKPSKASAPLLPDTKAAAKFCREYCRYAGGDDHCIKCDLKKQATGGIYG